MTVRVQAEDFDVAAELAVLQARCPNAGAVASFIGLVRGNEEGQAVKAMTLEHYPGMTEKALAEIVAEARRRWELAGTAVVHRVGRLLPGERIVLVAVASGHRDHAFAACQFIMDYLKTQAPFWKKEELAAGSRWVEAKDSDRAAAARWTEPGSAA